LEQRSAGRQDLKVEEELNHLKKIVLGDKPSCHGMTPDENENNYPLTLILFHQGRGNNKMTFPLEKKMGKALK
jgi:hypothetical protein